jgi:demethylmenaquinone methyltransferase / 2-methoxy-6-polyprenyl-1,4-benzoquinol methylase
MHLVIPLIGRLVAGDPQAYRYLPASSESFLTAGLLAGRMTTAGFRKVGYQRRMFGTIAIHWGEKE